MSDDLSQAGSSGEPEYLEQGSGRPLAPGSDAPGGSRTKAALIGIAAFGTLALVGAGTWVAIALAGGGPQPAEALPDATLGYVSIDLDPSAGQKIEALRTLRQFPALADVVDLKDHDDLRREVFDWLQSEAECAHLDYDDDVAPWLGERAAVAAVALDEDGVVPVAVLAVTDEAKAEAGLAKLRNCSATGDADEASSDAESSDGGSTGWAVADGWAVLAETEADANEVQAATLRGSLGDDETHQRWMDEIGDPGIVTVYAAPEAGASWLSLVDELEGEAPGGSALLPEETRTQLEDFGGMAGALRFADGGVELEFAAEAGPELVGVADGNEAGAAVSALPEDTVAALGVSLGDDWFSTLVEQMSNPEAGQSADQLLASLEAQTGLELPEDVETLLGDSFVLSLGGEVDLEALEGSSDPSGAQIGATITGDDEAIEEVLDKLRVQLPPGMGWLDSDSADGTVVVGPSAEYREALLAGGDLGDSETFQGVVAEPDRANPVAYLDFDGADNWLAELAGDDPEVAENLEPLSAFGWSSWIDGDTAHGVIRLTTD